jgi:hypothetical protein
VEAYPVAGRGDAGHSWMLQVRGQGCHRCESTTCEGQKGATVAGPRNDRRVSTLRVGLVVTPGQCVPTIIV